MTLKNTDLIDAIRRTVCMEVNGGELEPLWNIYKPNGVEIALRSNIVRLLGLDPNMTVGELHHRLAIAERAQACARAGQRLGVTMGVDATEANWPTDLTAFVQWLLNGTEDA